MALFAICYPITSEKSKGCDEEDCWFKLIFSFNILNHFKGIVFGWKLKLSMNGSNMLLTLSFVEESPTLFDDVAFADDDVILPDDDDILFIFCFVFVFVFEKLILDSIFYIIDETLFQLLLNSLK